MDDHPFPFCFLLISFLSFSCSFSFPFYLAFRLSLSIHLSLALPLSLLLSPSLSLSLSYSSSPSLALYRSTPLSSSFFVNLQSFFPPSLVHLTLRTRGLLIAHSSSIGSSFLSHLYLKMTFNTKYVPIDIKCL